ncbi:MAG: ABC transporter ATP-binding protein, partial [Hyphomonadaceae bacterium]
LDDYRALVLDADRRAAEAVAAAPARVVEPTPAARGPSAFTLKQRLGAAEKKLLEAQAVLAALDEKLSDPSLFARDPRAGARLAQERAAAAAAMTRAEEAWLEAGEALEALGA